MRVGGFLGLGEGGGVSHAQNEPRSRTLTESYPSFSTNWRFSLLTREGRGLSWSPRQQEMGWFPGPNEIELHSPQSSSDLIWMEATLFCFFVTQGTKHGHRLTTSAKQLFNLHHKFYIKKHWWLFMLLCQCREINESMWTNPTLLVCFSSFVFHDFSSPSGSVARLISTYLCKYMCIYIWAGLPWLE